jgi:hypothetical protein
MIRRQSQLKVPQSIEKNQKMWAKKKMVGEGVVQS